MSEKPEPTPVERIAQILAQGEMEVLYGRTGEDQQLEKVHLILGRDAKDREYLLQVFFTSDIAEILDVGEPDQGYESVLLQFFLLFPYDIRPSAMPEALRGVNLINRALPLGHLGISEPDGAFFLSYQLALEDREVPELILQDVVGLLGFAVAAFGDVLDLVGKGSLSADQLVRQLSELGLDPSQAADTGR